MRIKYILSTFTTLIVIEILLRIVFGFCDTVLMEKDKDYEYIPQPNQDRYRFQNHINYNSYSMRSTEPDSSAIKILCFGDSVINGGVMTDQDSLATEILSTKISHLWKKKVQFLNVSAGSWGPDNCFAYLQKHGNFGAKAIVLIVSSHDAYDNMKFEKVIDVHPSFPSEQYPIAVYELWDRYLFPRLKRILSARDKADRQSLGISKKTDSDTFNAGFSNFVQYSKNNNLPFYVYLHAEKGELKNGHYNKQGQEIIEYLKTNQIPVLKDLDLGLKEVDFRDDIHLSQIGQRNLANNVYNFIQNKEFVIAE